MLNCRDCLPTAKCSSLASGPVGYLQKVGLLGSFGSTPFLSNCNQMEPQKREMEVPSDFFHLTLARVTEPVGDTLDLNRVVASSHLVSAARLPAML